jgi:hypothetical protein
VPEVVTDDVSAGYRKPRIDQERRASDLLGVGLGAQPTDALGPYSEAISPGALPAHRHLEVGGGGPFDQHDSGLAGDVDAELDAHPFGLLGRLP